MELKPKDIERISKALSDPQRIKILEYVKKGGCGASCSGVIELLNLAQPSVSHHLKQLTDSGLLIPTKDGRQISYTIDKEFFTAYINHLVCLNS